jgi:hypothetical protein
MRLVELLARDLDKWPGPNSEDGPIESMSQAGDMQVSHYSGSRQVWREDVSDWSSHGYVTCGRFTLHELATDHATAIVTRPQWEAEKARIAGKADGGWKRNRGRSGKCPVAKGVIIELRDRDGDIYATEGCRLRWNHIGSGGDIMAYRIHKPAEQPAPVSDDQAIDLQLACAEENLPADTMLQIRDRIRTLDAQRAEVEATYQRQIGEIGGKREGLVAQLKAEGLALVEDPVRPVEDMSDAGNWKIGDIAEVISIADFASSELSVGDVVPITRIDTDGTIAAAHACWGKPGKAYKFVSRPAS